MILNLLENTLFVMRGSFLIRGMGTAFKMMGFAICYKQETRMLPPPTTSRIFFGKKTKEKKERRR